MNEPPANDADKRESLTLVSVRFDPKRRQAAAVQIKNTKTFRSHGWRRHFRFQKRWPSGFSVLIFDFRTSGRLQEANVTPERRWRKTRPVSHRSVAALMPKGVRSRRS